MKIGKVLLISLVLLLAISCGSKKEEAKAEVEKTNVKQEEVKKTEEKPKAIVTKEDIPLEFIMKKEKFFYQMQCLCVIIGIVLIVVFSPIVLFFQILRKVFFFKEESVGKYIHTVAISLDQLGAALIYGEEDWCVSSLAYYDYKYENKNKWFMHFINFLFNDKEHC